MLSQEIMTKSAGAAYYHFDAFLDAFNEFDNSN
jgi:hypothetical protein